MAQVQVKTKRQVASTVSSHEVIPVEVAQLLNVLARIEIRRQAKLRIMQQEAN